jgi:sodium transport system ATP-binding protein
LIKSEQITKIFETKSGSLIAVNDVSFKVQPGEIYGLLGPNGAGKTTSLRMLATLLKPTKGQITVNGFSTEKEPGKVRGSLGFLTAQMKLSPNFTPHELVTFYGKLNRMPKKIIAAREKFLFSRFKIEEYRDLLIDKLSHGNAQKAAIAVALIHDPKVIIFDEPTSGLDIMTAKSVTDLLMAEKTRGKTIIVSTHYMAIAEKLCDRIGILLNGKLLASGTVAELNEKYGVKSLEETFFKLADKVEIREAA